MQESLLKVLMAVSEGNSDEAADLVIRIGQKTEGFDPEEFRRRIRQLISLRQNQGLQQLSVGRSLLEVNRNAAENGLFVPSELTLLGKTLLQLDEVGKILDPTFDPNASVRRNVGEIMTQRMRKNVTQGGVYSSLLEMKDFMTSLPSRLNQIMDAITNAELEVKVKAVDAKMVVDGIEKVANRITAGIMLAALVIGAALLMQVQTSFQIFGYPGLAILLFLGAAAGGFWLVIIIFIHDHKSRKKSQH
jgi:ubiquinone biosynthesis protein